MSRLAWDGTAEPVSREQILRRDIHFFCSADHEQDWQPLIHALLYVMAIHITYEDSSNQSNMVTTGASNRRDARYKVLNWTISATDSVEVIAVQNVD